MIDLNALSEVKVANRKNGSGQTFKFRYNEKRDLFKFSDQVYETLGLGQGVGLKQYNAEDKVFIVVMSEDKAVFCKNFKGREFKNTELTTALKERGILAKELDVEFVEAQEVGKIYSIVQLKEEEDQEEDTSDQVVDNQVHAPEQEENIPEDNF